MGTDDENVQAPSTHRFASVPSVVSFSFAANQTPRLRQTGGNRRRAFVTLGTPTLGMLGPRSRPGCPRGAGLPRVARLRPLPKGTLMSLHRRRFLEDSLLAAAAALAAGPMTGVLAAEDKPSRSTAEKLSVACVGVRGRGASHYGFFAGRPDAEVTYICDVDEKVANRAADGIAQKQGRRPKVQK